MLSRKETLEIGYIASEIDYTFEQFKETFRDWKVRPIEYQNKTIGMIVWKGPHFHLSVLPEYRGKWATRGFIKKYIQPLYDKYGYLETATTDDKLFNPKLNKIFRAMKRFGFKEYRRLDKEKITIYRLEKSEVLQ